MVIGSINGWSLDKERHHYLDCKCKCHKKYGRISICGNCKLNFEEIVNDI